MKKTVKLPALICALVMMVSLAACGEKKEEPAASSSEEEVKSSVADYEWVKFEMPAGWTDAKGTGGYVTVTEDADAKHIVKLSTRSYMWQTELQDVIDKFIEYDGDRYKAESPTQIGSHKFYPLRFSFEGQQGVLLYCAVDDAHYCEISISQMTETDPAIRTILNSIEFDASKIK